MDGIFLLDVAQQLLAALPKTLELFICSVTLGAVFALGITAMRVSKNALLSGFAKGYVFVFRGSPLLIQTYLLYYGVAEYHKVFRPMIIWPVLSNPFFCAVLALALCTAGYQAEIMRGGLQAVSGKEIEAARSTGMSGFLLLRRIIAPIALRQALPAYSTEIVLMVKSTSLASLITVWEVTGVAQRLIHETYRTFEVFLVAATIYLVVNFIIVRILALFEYSLSPHLRARPESA